MTHLKKKSHASEYLPQTSHHTKYVWGWFWRPHVIDYSPHSCWSQQLYEICYPQTSKTQYPKWKQATDTHFIICLISIKTLLYYENIIQVSLLGQPYLGFTLFQFYENSNKIHYFMYVQNRVAALTEESLEVTCWVSQDGQTCHANPHLI